MVPHNFQLLYTEQAIAREVARLGSEITGWVAQVRAGTGADVLTLPVLRGGIFFFADLVRQIQASVDLAPVSAASYDTGANVQRDSISMYTGDIVVRDRTVLIVDDVCDSGRTLAALCQAMRDAGAAEVRSTVLIKRELPTPSFEPDWVGLRYSGPEWFVGYGMDDRDRWRNLGAIYTMKPA